MKRSRTDSAAASSVREYRDCFIMRVHELLILGYDRMTQGKFANREEEVITQELVSAIEQVLDDPSDGIGDWVDCFSVHEDKRLNAPGRHGKKRLRIDIRIDSAEIRPRSRFSFEAKRLGKGHSASVYLGPEGLGAFLSGEYAANDPDAGMLGYVQSNDPAYWAREIENALSGNPSQYACRQGKTWNLETLVAGLQFIFSSTHDRSSLLPEVRVFHTLLLFH